MKNIALLIGLVIFSIGLIAPASAASGEKLFKTKCAMCHSIEEGKKKIGPSLYGVFGRVTGTLEGYKFSKDLKNTELVWDAELLMSWIKSPKSIARGTKMRSRGIKKHTDRLAIIEYLREATKPKEE